MLLRERETEKGLLVSICDPDCIGETFDNGRATLEVTEEFYGGPEADEATRDEVLSGLQRAQVANVVGEEAVGVAVEAGFVDEEAVLEFDGTRHAQLLTL